MPNKGSLLRRKVAEAKNPTSHFVREQRGLRGLSNLRIFTRSGENIGGNGISLETPLIACFQKNEFKIIGVWGLKNGSHRRALGCGVVSLSSFTLWIGVCRPRRGFDVQQTATLKHGHRPCQ